MVFGAIYADLMADKPRLEQIIKDVLAAYNRNAKILLLTTWRAHLDLFAEQVPANRPGSCGLVRWNEDEGQSGPVARLAESDAATPLLVIGTGSYIGEGFDCPQLDTLFLAAPISFKGRLVQYAGRITRPYPGKTHATVHDYHDELTPVLALALNKRAPGYLSLGFPDPRKM